MLICGTRPDRQKTSNSWHLNSLTCWAPRIADDPLAVGVQCGHESLAEGARRARAQPAVVVVNRHVHLPSQVVREVVLGDRVAHGNLAEPAVAQADGGGRGHNLERRVLGLVGEQSAAGAFALKHHRIGHVASAPSDVRCRGVVEDPLGHDLRAFLPTAELSELDLLRFPVHTLLEPARPVGRGHNVDQGHNSVRRCIDRIRG